MQTAEDFQEFQDDTHNKNPNTTNSKKIIFSRKSFIHFSFSVLQKSWRNENQAKHF